MLLCLFGEGGGAAAGGLDEQVEGTVGLGHFVAVGAEGLGEQAAVFVVGLQVRAQTHAPGDDLLHQAGSADMTARPGGTGNGGIEGIVVGAVFGHIDIADALAGQTQALGPGVADDGVVVMPGIQGAVMPP